jgi:hypothetical protein
LRSCEHWIHRHVKHDIGGAAAEVVPLPDGVAQVVLHRLVGRLLAQGQSYTRASSASADGDVHVQAGPAGRSSSRNENGA